MSKPYGDRRWCILISSDEVSLSTSASADKSDRTRQGWWKKGSLHLLYLLPALRRKELTRDKLSGFVVKLFRMGVDILQEMKVKRWRLTNMNLMDGNNEV
jgi:hypothetical protein